MQVNGHNIFHLSCFLVTKMRLRTKLIWPSIALCGLRAGTGCMRRTQGRAQGAFRWVVDPMIVPNRSEVPSGPQGPRPLAAVRDADGIVSSFVANELVIAPPRSTDLPRLLALSGG